METLYKPWLPWEEEMKCSVCGRGSDGDMCRRHEAARDRLRAAYPLWVSAYGDIGWMEYLDNVKRNVQTGQWAKEVAEFLQGG